MGVIIDGIVEANTDLAILLRREGKLKPLWVPLSVIKQGGDEGFEVGDEVEIEVRTWFAEREGIA
jgi:hypothetical protein